MRGGGPFGWRRAVRCRGPRLECSARGAAVPCCLPPSPVPQPRGGSVHLRPAIEARWVHRFHDGARPWLDLGSGGRSRRELPPAPPDPRPPPDGPDRSRRAACRASAGAWPRRHRRGRSLAVGHPSRRLSGAVGQRVPAVGHRWGRPAPGSGSEDRLGRRASGRPRRRLRPTRRVVRRRGAMGPAVTGSRPRGAPRDHPCRGRPCSWASAHSGRRRPQAARVRRTAVRRRLGLRARCRTPGGRAGDRSPRGVARHRAA